MASTLVRVRMPGCATAARVLEPGRVSRWLLKGTPRAAFADGKRDEPQNDQRRRPFDHRFDGVPEHSQRQVLSRRTSVQTVKGYTPPADLEIRMKNLTEKLCGGVSDWRSISLEDRRLKFKLLTRFIEEFDHNIPNMDMSGMKSVDDAVVFFQTAVRDSSSYEDLKKLDLPKNLHIQLEYLRFDPDTDKMFGGRSAFPGRPTVVTSLKYRHKYKGHDAPLPAPKE